VAIASLLLSFSNDNVNGEGTKADKDSDSGLVDHIESFLSTSEDTREDRLEVAQRLLSNRASRRRRTKHRQLLQEPDGRERERELGGSTDGDHWQTMKLVVEADTQAFRRILRRVRLIPQDSDATISANFEQGDILVGGRCELPAADECGTFDNNNMFRRNNPNVPVGISFQTCITATPKDKGISQWLCTWVLSFSDMVMNQVMAQGNYFRSTTLQINSWAPQYQFLAITGGTGIFRGVTGFIIISPRDFGVRLGSAESNPMFWYYLVYKLI
jgi:hypothetical protein